MRRPGVQCFYRTVLYSVVRFGGKCQSTAVWWVLVQHYHVLLMLQGLRHCNTAAMSFITETTFFQSTKSIESKEMAVQVTWTLYHKSNHKCTTSLFFVEKNPLIISIEIRLTPVVVVTIFDHHYLPLLSLSTYFVFTTLCNRLIFQSINVHSTLNTAVQR